MTNVENKIPEAVYVLNTLINGNNKESTKRRIIEKHPNDQNVLFFIPVTSSSESNNARYPNLVSTHKSESGQVSTIFGSKTVFERLLEEEKKSEYEISLGFVAVTVPSGSSNEGQVEFDFIPSSEALAKYVKTFGLLLPTGFRDYVHQINGDVTTSNLVLQNSMIYKEFTKEGAVGFLNDENILPIRQSEKIKQSKTYILTLRPIKIFIDPSEQAYGRSRTRQRLLFLYEKIKDSLKFLMENCWIEINHDNIRNEFSWITRKVSLNEKRTKGITNSFITKSFDFDMCFPLMKFFADKVSIDFRCKALVEYMANLGSSLSLANFAGVTMEINIRSLSLNAVPSYDYTQESIDKKAERKIEMAKPKSKQLAERQQKTAANSSWSGVVNDRQELDEKKPLQIFSVDKDAKEKSSRTTSPKDGPKGKPPTYHYSNSLSIPKPRSGK